MKRLLPIIFLTSLVGMSPQTQCINCDDIYTIVKEKPINALIATLLSAGVFRFLMKRASAEPSRFNKEKLKEALEKKEYKEVLNQLWYFMDDVIIGRQGKGSTIKVLPDGKTLDVGAACNEIGIGGKIHSNLIPLAKTFGFIFALHEFVKKASNGIDSWFGFLGASAGQPADEKPL